MPFSNEILAGIELVRAAIASDNYLAGVSGWQITRDGNAEFNNGTFRGALNLNGANGAFIHIVLDIAGTPFIFINLPNVPGHVTGDGQINGVYGTNNSPGIEIITPTIDGGSSAAIQLFGADTAGGVPTIIYAGVSDFLNLINATAGITNTGAPVDSGRSATGSTAYLTRVVGEAAARLTILASGSMQWSDGTNPADARLYRSAAGVLAAGQLVSDVAGTAETWHAMALVNAWVNSGGTDPPAQYRLVPLGNAVQIVGSIKSGTNANGTTVATLPVGYRPATHKVLMPVAVDTIAGTAYPRMTLNTTGAITIDNCTSAGFLFFNHIIPLDA